MHAELRPLHERLQLLLSDAAAPTLGALQRAEQGLYFSQPPLPGVLAARGRAPGEPEPRAALEQCLHLQWLLHIGHKRAALDAVRRMGRVTNRRPAVTALAGALESGWHLLCAHARSHGALPPGFWADSLALVAAVHSLGWRDKRADDTAASLGLLCQRLVLLGLCQTNHLDAATLERLLQIVGEEAGTLLIRPLRNVAEPVDVFAFQAGVDRPPRFVEQIAGADSSWWHVGLDALVAENGRRLGALQGDALPSPLELQLRARLQQAWQSPPRRRHARRRPPRDERIELVASLPACWALLSVAANLPPRARWPVPAPPAGTNATFAVPAPACFTVADYSLSGLSLAGDEAPPGLLAGEVVLLRRDGRPWQLGLVRWLGFPGGEAGVRCGIEIVGQNPEARLIAAVSSHAAPVFEQAIQLRGGRRVVVNGRPFQPLREFLLADPAAVHACLARRLLSQTTRHQVFELKHLAADAGAPDASGSTARI